MIRRVSRDDDYDDENDKDRRSQQRGGGEAKELREVLRGVPDDQVADILGDEFADFLAKGTAAADKPRFRLGQDAPDPQESTKPVLHLVKTDDTEQDPNTARTSPAGLRPQLRPQLLRVGVGGSLAVLAVLTLAAWGQPAAVVIPLFVYGLGWVAYLWWNAALRPPLPQAAATMCTAVGRILAAIARGFCHPFAAGVARLEAVRARHETTRTTAA
ncbi:hypothetical protein [Nocardia seriolae]|uniref:Uncharacterized protein n=1 Tax=Nocardia seriolae TaxID=37332 RepID=A0A0B8NPH6_9NOCA|nr:hypothetical protein [Nocardia seriolae]APA97600.1 hypothetical protein NS506_03548 [Nocardia seriolae]MTJ62484.1 hypothetical protein [Nocardia seriolae]MTJ75510.1 hypothetical protein [Nocardia seriolae]MTJ87385.1 hypothetical protein [Nocardia seriolae]MTK31377.1 hypothetical protein [Nocardia seriolae]